jgi:cyclopropane fatty-acyl-phospholipid synthase-like methyltransferase
MKRGYPSAPDVEQTQLVRQRWLNNIIQADLLEWLDSTRERFDAVVTVDLIEHFDS